MWFVSLVASIAAAALTAAAVAPALSTSSTASFAVAASPASAVCEELRTTLPPSCVLIPSSNNDAAYTAARTNGFNPLNNVLRPICIVQPATTQETATAMRSIYAHAAPYAVRAGGHTGMAGWDSVASGILLDLSRLTGFHYDAAAAVVHVGPGLRWEQIYEYAEEHGVAPMGGRVGHVGTGLLLGGGLSLLSPLYGYACDGIIAAEVVAVDGGIRWVDAESDPQLLRAIKGGGGRVGIVTRYILRAFSTGTRDEKRWFGGTVTSLDRTGMDAMVRLTEQFVAQPRDDARATVLTNVGLLKHNSSTLWLGTTFLFYKGTQQDFERVFQPMLAIDGAAVDVKPMSYYEVTKVTPLGWSSSQAYKWIGGSLYPSRSTKTYSSLWSSVQTFLAQHEHTLDSAFLSFTPVRTHQIDAGYLVGGNALSPPRGRSYSHWLFSNILAPGTTAFPPELELDRLRLIKENPPSAGLPLLLNEVDASQKVFETYGWFEELKRVYTRVDPSGFSVKHQQGPVL
ncbi:hypothetical protein EX895_002100 [Sporisorium graminicola]|uniref:FAD-binding PCMH-type domain-containing protein n=1 Tax=Sporisorium graminicola TaxID=280036 RepID=A0A4V6EU18_9BASI|nr:hypothetical protein EX895_002100 [Sporisorium graminicola]TKY88859.1 hypothetical protein EX895_002100 [Sporisorium graminicola]